MNRKTFNADKLVRGTKLMVELAEHYKLPKDWTLPKDKSPSDGYTRTDPGTGRVKPLTDDDWPKN